VLDRFEQQHAVDGSDRQRPMSARAAAEALFALKQPVAKPLEAESPAPADPAAHKPRVFSITPPPSAPREKSEPATCAAPSRIAPTISPSLVARIHAWAKYGMTVRQVAQVTGVAADEIERVLRQR